MSSEPTKRFSNRVENYLRYRPHYPPGLIDLLREYAGLAEEHSIADIGSGTGLLTELFLRNGNLVYGVEPNTEMRVGGEDYLSIYANRFISVDGSAEDSGLESGSVDFVVAGQAFHWFDREKFRGECSRILKPGGRIVLIWNKRLEESSPFLVEYEQMLRSYANDYAQVDHRNIDENVLSDFFGARGYKRFVLENFQYFDFEGLKGRLLSSSYCPLPGEENYALIMEKLAEIFRRYEESDSIRFDYDTEIYLGH